jgi:hypothetical protein
MALPPLTPDQRAAASEKAAKTGRERTEVRNAFETGRTTLSAALSPDQTDDTIGKMKVSALLESLPGVDKGRVRQAMERLGIAESRRVRDLRPDQRVALEHEFGGDIGSGSAGPPGPGSVGADGPDGQSPPPSSAEGDAQAVEGKVLAGGISADIVDPGQGIPKEKDDLGCRPTWR